MSRKKNKIRLPDKNRMLEAMNAFVCFREMCALQLDQGYWTTVTFPSENHLNKILSIQLIDAVLVEKEYGSLVSQRLFDLIPYCKHYMHFVKGSRK